MGHLGEDGVAQLAEQGAGHAHGAVGDQKGDRQHQDRMVGAVQAVDDALERQGDGDIGHLGQDQASQRQEPTEK